MIFSENFSVSFGLTYFRGTLTVVFKGLIGRRKKKKNARFSVAAGH